MKYFILWVLILGGCQSSHEQKVPRFDKKSLETHFRTRNLNVLVMWDQRIIGLDDENTFAVALKSFLKEFLNNYRARIVVSGLDGNPPYFFLSSNSNNLPSDYSSLFYSIERLDLKKFDRRYNPNVSILKSAKELISNFSLKNFFLPENDFVIFTISTKDDENYLIDMAGKKYQDKLEEDVQNLLRLTRSTWSVEHGQKKDFSFTQLRLFVAAAKSPCHESLVSADRLFYAASRINANYTLEKDNWQRDKEIYDLCSLNFKNFFDNALQVIESRYEKKLNERELIPRTPEE